jgi:hypothetical protein
VTKAEDLQGLLSKRNFCTSVRLDIIHEGQPKTVHALVLERPEGSPNLEGGFGRGGPGGGRGGPPGGRGGPDGRGGPGGRGGFFGGSNSTLSFTDADGNQQKVSGDQMRDFWQKMREDEKFRDAVSKQGVTITIRPDLSRLRAGGDSPPPPPNP